VGREGLEDLDRRRSVLPARDKVQTRRLAEKDVLRHVELRNEAELLADKSDAERQRVAWTLDLNDAKRVNLDFARVWRTMPNKTFINVDLPAPFSPSSA
jgi:hypothetical protein